MPCPLCAATETAAYYEDRVRPYRQCSHCQLVFVPPSHHLSAAAEKAEYDLHENAVDDPAYRGFLSRLAEPLLHRIPANSSGLDFGCGPAAALADILRSAGHSVCTYDIYYQPQRSVLQGEYDFISATEVIEHLAQPAAVLDQLWALLRRGGTLGLMTKLLIDRDHFAAWHYIRDPTHIAFYSRGTLQWLAQRYGASLDIVGADVILLGKN